MYGNRELIVSRGPNSQMTCKKILKYLTFPIAVSWWANSGLTLFEKVGWFHQLTFLRLRALGRGGAGVGGGGGVGAHAGLSQLLK